MAAEPSSRAGATLASALLDESGIGASQRLNILFEWDVADAGAYDQPPCEPFWAADGTWVSSSREITVAATAFGGVRIAETVDYLGPVTRLISVAAILSRSQWSRRCW